jgi:hypothetical protein
LLAALGSDWQTVSDIAVRAGWELPRWRRAVTVPQALEAEGLARAGHGEHEDAMWRLVEGAQADPSWGFAGRPVHKDPALSAPPAPADPCSLDTLARLVADDLAAEIADGVYWRTRAAWKGQR